MATKKPANFTKIMPSLKNLKRITDPDYLLCHRCGLPLRDTAHRECAEAARRESGQMGKEPSKIKHALISRPFEGVGTLGHSPCRLEDGTSVIPADGARKIREEGFISRENGVQYSPWTNGVLRERATRIWKEVTEEIEVEEEIEDWDLLDSDKDLYYLAYDRPNKPLPPIPDVDLQPESWQDII